MEHSHECVTAASRSWDRPLVTVPTSVGVALVGGQFPSFSTAATLWTLGAGAVLICLGLDRRVPRRPAVRRLPAGAGWWLLPVAVFALFEAVTFAADAGHEFPTFSRLMDPVLEHPTARSAAWLAWLAAFWGLVRR